MFKIKVNPNIAAGMSKYRLIDEAGNEVKQINEYLDSLVVRGRSDKTISVYAYSLLNFWRWLTEMHINFKNITQNTLLEYIRYQKQTSSPAPTTINRRLTVAGNLYQYHFDSRISTRAHSKKHSFKPSVIYRMGWLRPTSVVLHKSLDI